MTDLDREVARAQREALVWIDQTQKALAGAATVEDTQRAPKTVQGPVRSRERRDTAGSRNETGGGSDDPHIDERTSPVREVQHA